MAQIKVEPVLAEREFDGKKYVLSKINYTEEDAKADQAYYKERGMETRILQEGIFWLVYTKMGQ